MAIIRVGDTTARVVEERREFDPVAGNTTTQVWEGDEDDLIPQGQLFRAAGYRVSIYQINGPVYRMLVSMPDMADGSPDAVTDTWERVEEMATIDLRNNPILIKTILTTVTPAKSASSLINKLYTEIRTKLKDGVEFSYDNTAIQAMADLIGRGAEAYEHRRVVLRRRRSVHISKIAQSNVTALEKIYTTPKLIELFEVPPAVAAKLPPDPPPENTPSNTIWGWRERGATSTLTIGSVKAEEVNEFVFAALSTLLYEVA
jgi:hypothetical protein